ncbi:MAG TPA: nitrilase-related carbon-nitrogen hydrolase [Chthoniobacterales bacterium]
MRIAVAQIACAVGDVAANVSKLRDYAARAKSAGAEWVVFPEMSDTGYVMSVIREHASPWSEGAVPQLQASARELALGIICGVSERTTDCIFNTQVVIDARGEIAGKYRKTHLFSPAPIEEDKCFRAGEENAMAALGVFHAALSICYDLRFPEFYRAAACGNGANVFVISSAWPFPRVEHLRVLATARAIENQSYVVLSNRVGSDAGVTFCGNSAIIDPYGVVIAAASADREELIVAELSDEVLRAVRERMPIFAHRRPQLYAL